VANLVIHERRESYAPSGVPRSWAVSLTLEQTNAVTLHAPANNKVVILELDTGYEVIYDGADIVYGNHPVGNVVIERYSMGARQQTHELALPPFQAGMTSTPANDVIDFQLFAGGSALHKNVYSTTRNGHSVIADARYEKTMTQVPNLDQTIVDLLATPKGYMPTGRYEVPAQLGNLALDVYPEGVVIAHYNSATARLLPSWNVQKAFAGTAAGTAIGFIPGTKQLSGSNVNLFLTAAHRTK
jgi:hypothetical protein